MDRHRCSEVEKAQTIGLMAATSSQSKQVTRQGSFNARMRRYYKCRAPCWQVGSQSIGSCLASALLPLPREGFSTDFTAHDDTITKYTRSRAVASLFEDQRLKVFVQNKLIASGLPLPSDGASIATAQACQMDDEPSTSAETKINPTPASRLPLR